MNEDEVQKTNDFKQMTSYTIMSTGVIPLLSARF